MTQDDNTNDDLENRLSRFRSRGNDDDKHDDDLTLDKKSTGNLKLPPPPPLSSRLNRNKEKDDSKKSPLSDSPFSSSRDSLRSRLQGAYQADDYDYVDDGEYFDDDDDENNPPVAPSWRDQLAPPPRKSPLSGSRPLSSSSLRSNSSSSSNKTDWRSRLSGSSSLPGAIKHDDITTRLWVEDNVWASFYMPDLPDVKDKDVNSIKKIFAQAESDSNIADKILAYLDTYWQTEVNLVGAVLMTLFSEEKAQELRPTETLTVPQYLDGAVSNKPQNTYLLCRDYPLTWNVLARSTDYVLLADARAIIEEDRLNRWLVTNDNRLVELVRKTDYKEVRI